MSQFTHKGCVFEIEIENNGRNKCEFYGRISLVSVSGKVLDIPNTYEGEPVNFVYVSESSSAVNTGNLFEYYEVGSTESTFSSVEEIRIPASLHDMIIDRNIFPNLSKVVIDSENKHFRMVDEKLLCTSGDSLLAYCGKEELDEYTIPDGITQIGSGAFSFTKIHKINFPSSVVLVDLHCVDHSVFLEDLDDIVEFARTVYALKKDVDELVITDFKKFGREIFSYGLPKKLVFDMEVIKDFPYWLNFKQVDTVEFRNPKMYALDALTFCHNFRHLIVSPDSVNYCVMDDVLFSKDKTRLLLYPNFKEDAEYVVPEGILEIGSFAFKDNLFCKSIQLPMTLRELCENFIVSISSLQNLGIPESIHAFRFKNIYHATIEHFKVPRSICILGTNSIIMSNAVIDATEVEYFADDSVTCKKLIIGNGVKFANHGAFHCVESLKTPELKLYKFMEVFFSWHDINLHIARDSNPGLKYVEATRDDGSVLNLAIPISKESVYQQAIFSSWGENGISIERYAEALVQLRNTEIKYKAIAYCLEHNSVEFVEELLSKINHITKGLVSWAIERELFTVVTVLCKGGLVRPTLAKELLKGKLLNVLIPVVMSVLEGRQQSDRFFL